MEQNAESALTLATLTCYKRHVAISKVTGQLIKFVALSQATVPLSIATKDCRIPKVASQTGIFLVVLVWALAISKGLMLHAVAAPTGMRIVFKCLQHPTHRNAITRTRLGLQLPNLASSGSRKHAPLHIHTHMMI
jgi:hypothetical protein